MAEIAEKQVYTLEEAADELGLSRATMNRRIADPSIFPNAWKTGPGRTSRWRIPLSDIEAFKKEHGREELESEEQE